MIEPSVLKFAQIALAQFGHEGTFDVWFPTIHDREEAARAFESLGCTTSRSRRDANALTVTAPSS